VFELCVTLCHHPCCSVVQIKGFVERVRRAFSDQSVVSQAPTLASIVIEDPPPMESPLDIGGFFRVWADVALTVWRRCSHTQCTPTGGLSMPLPRACVVPSDVLTALIAASPTSLFCVLPPFPPFPLPQMFTPLRFFPAVVGAASFADLFKPRHRLRPRAMPGTGAASLMPHGVVVDEKFEILVQVRRVLCVVRWLDQAPRLVVHHPRVHLLGPRACATRLCMCMCMCMCVCVRVHCLHASAAPCCLSVLPQRVYQMGTGCWAWRTRVVSPWWRWLLGYGVLWCGQVVRARNVPARRPTRSSTFDARGSMGTSRRLPLPGEGDVRGSGVGAFGSGAGFGSSSAPGGPAQGELHTVWCFFRIACIMWHKFHACPQHAHSAALEAAPQT
jgi:hypothetical protein